MSETEVYIYDHPDYKKITEIDDLCRYCKRFKSSVCNHDKCKPRSEYFDGRRMVEIEGDCEPYYIPFIGTDDLPKTSKAAYQGMVKKLEDLLKKEQSKEIWDSQKKAKASLEDHIDDIHYDKEVNQTVVTTRQGYEQIINNLKAEIKSLKSEKKVVAQYHVDGPETKKLYNEIADLNRQNAILQTKLTQNDKIIMMLMDYIGLLQEGEE